MFHLHCTMFTCTACQNMTNSRRRAVVTQQIRVKHPWDWDKLKTIEEMGTGSRQRADSLSVGPADSWLYCTVSSWCGAVPFFHSSFDMWLWSVKAWDRAWKWVSHTKSLKAGSRRRQRLMKPRKRRFRGNAGALTAANELPAVEYMYLLQFPQEDQ